MEIILVLAIIATGGASRYDPHVMESNIRVRQVTEPWELTDHTLPPDVSQFRGYAAVLDCNLIGTVMLVQINNGPWEEWLAADCGCPIGAAWMRNGNIVLEMDYGSAVRHGTVGQRTPVANVVFTGIPAELWGEAY